MSSGKLSRVLNLSPVEPLGPHHNISGFTCGKHDLDYWFAKYARTSNEAGGGRVFVTAEPDGQVAGFYALATGAVDFAKSSPEMQADLSANFPVSTIKLTRMAVDRRFQKQEVGRSLLIDAMSRTLRLSRDAGVKALVVDALDDEVRGFYKHFGFRDLPGERLTLFHLVQDIAASLP